MQFGDWSSDVCSSDLAYWKTLRKDPGTRAFTNNHLSCGASPIHLPSKVPQHLRTFNFTCSTQLIHRFFQKYEPQSPGICAFLLLIVPAAVSGVFKQSALSVLVPLLRTYAIFHSTLISSIVLYRLSPIHPLAKYPGPVLAKISKLWFVSVHNVCGTDVPD